MPCSEARRVANQINAQKSTGPKTEEGKTRSRQNGLTHGLSGSVIAPAHDQAEVDARARDLEAEMKPRTSAGLLLVLRMALLSVRMDRAAAHDFAATAHRIRHAANDFDEARRDEAAQLFNALHEDPRNHLRKLRGTPEGVELLLDHWNDLLEDLTADPDKPFWKAAQMEQAALMTGTRTEHSRNCRIGVLSRAVWGDFARLAESEGGHLSEEDRQGWAKAKLLERIETEIAGLEAHYETLDFETIAIDRREAGARALFDSSKPATLARRYESEASRGFYKALKEFRQVEAAAQAEPVPPQPFETGFPLGSPREERPSVLNEPDGTANRAEWDRPSMVRTPDGPASRVERSPQRLA